MSVDAVVLKGVTSGEGAGLAQRRLSFNQDWRFLQADVEGAESEDFDDKSWELVSAPHTYNDVDTFAHFQSRNHSGEREQWSGRTWYRKTFRLPESARDKKVFVEFEAVRQLAEVFLNGVFLGKCENGFLPFGFDLSPHLKVEGENVLVVMCDNSFVSDEEGEIKWSSYEGGARVSWNNPHWHPAHGGIYRNVYLHVMDKLHVTLPLYNNLETVGTYVYTPEVSPDHALVGVEIELRNEYEDSRKCEVRTEILDAAGFCVLELLENAQLSSGETVVVSSEGRIENPNLWDPERPYLYRARTRVFVDGRVVDTVDTPLGIRFWEFTADRGFLMNGRSMKLQGWGQKSTNEWAGLGNAFPDWMHFYTMNQMREAGGNMVRWGHTAGSPGQLESSDRLGLITIQPGVDGEGDLEGHSWDVRAQAFRDAVVYFRNHPSILVWEGGNQAVSLPHVKQLRSYCDRFDPHGKRAYAHRRPSKVTIDYSDIEIGTQGGHKFRDKPVVEGEYNREECPRRVWDDYSPPDFGYKVPRKQEYELTSESFAVNQVVEFVRRLGASNHCGGANWIFSDSTSGGRNDCEVTRASGVVDAVRLPKEAFYACRALFHWEPQVHLIGHWTYPLDRVTEKPLYVVSNCSEVELFVNGESRGFGKMSYKYLFTFDSIRWEAGEVEVVAYDGEGNEQARQRKETVATAVALRVTPIVGPEGFMADGSDVALFDVEAVDSEGRRHPTFQQRVEFDLAGPAVWRGGYNSGKEHSTNHLYLDLECGINRVAVRSTREAGRIELTARGSGLEPASVVLEAGQVGVESGVGVSPSAMPYDLSSGELKLVDEEMDGVSFEQSEGNYIKGFSYSGTRLSLPVMSNAEDGLQPYVDCDDYFEEIPEFMRGADYIQTSDGEKLYEAVDLMDFSVSERGTLYIAHDDRLSTPGWLKAYEKLDTGFVGRMQARPALELNDARLVLYGRKLEKNESVTLGSNREVGPDECRMYSVIFVPETVSDV
ncbi:sugar-binding domain-containing protein [Pelagicoccus mobilis]|uniref:DUF4982 domain-containing protein n=1 Tax=Pelagicoccus mobilis TaxID=415221 RepID=A0A934RVT3_9BACT|nr:sugar-binding domain-containing protein [Pelagicoccus mobilis]MBK1875337.1 DUF4982 domain-containing protein [Pelagicoccus mobilis]